MRTHFSAFLGILLLSWSLPVWAVSMSFSGHFRTEAAYYNRLALSPAGEQAKTFLQSRALLTPSLVVDDHFSVKSQWSLLTSPGFVPVSTSPGLSTGNGGFIYGDITPTYLLLNRVWLEWTSDVGVFRGGRMPFSWGYGLLWDGGNNVWDDFQTTLDRLEYRLHLGHVIGGLGYSKLRKLSTLGSQNDQDFYSAFLQYDNPELEVEAGIIYEKQARSQSQMGDLAGPASPYKLPAGFKAYPLATKTPYPLSNNVVDVYMKKTVGYFSFGGELGWLTGDAIDYNGDGTKDNLNAFGLVLSSAYEYHTVKAFIEFLYASGDSNLQGNHLNGFVLLHRNRRPGLILGRELLGPYYNDGAGWGSPVVYGNQGSFSGVFYFRPGLRIDWTTAWSTGLEVIIAQKAATQFGEARPLGVEIDLGGEYAMYKNFNLGVNLGYLIPGQGLGVPNPQGAFAFRTTAGLTF